MITARTYVSTVLPHDAETVWARIADFGDYRWGEGVGEAEIEGGGDANRPGAVRSFLYYGQPSRQRLVDHDPDARAMRWESVAPFDATLAHYAASVRVTPVTTTGQSFVEWGSDFAAAPDAVARWDGLQRREFRKSLERLDLCLAWDQRAA